MTHAQQTLRALILWGGWDGHQPQEVAAIFATELASHGFAVDLPRR